MIRGRRIFYRQVNYLPKGLNSRTCVRRCGLVAQTEGNVFISPRIERGPTDILKALSLTVGADQTAFHYKYPDDPYFYPHSFQKKRNFALSLESGRKSARWIFKNNPGFFSHQLSEPPIQEFLVKPVFSDEPEPTEKTLLRAIEERNVQKAIEVFNTLKKANFEVSKSTRQCLLELICFYDSEEQLSENVEENWFLRDSNGAKNKTSWENKNFAEKLFEELDSNCSLANSAIIQGMFKHNEAQLAHQYFQAAKKRKVKLSVDAYNMLLSKIYEILHGKSLTGLMKIFLSDMSETKIMPNLGTLNAILSTLAEGRYFDGMIAFAQRVLAEFTKLGIKPSLGSYGYMFLILSYQRAKPGKSHFLAYSIMDDIENKNFEILHSSDLKFFNNAIIAFGYRNGDPDLSLRLLNMFFRNNNSKFICTFEDEINFFEYVFEVIFTKSPIDLAMDLYRRCAYTHYSMGQKVRHLIIFAIGKHKAPEYLTEVWEDMKKLKWNKSLAGELLNLIRFFSDKSSLKVFHSVAVLYLRNLNLEDFYSEDRSVISNILVALVKNDDEENILSFWKNFILNMEFKLSQNSMEALCNYAISKQNISLLLESLKLADDLKFPNVKRMASNALPFLEGDSKAWAEKIVNRKEAEKARQLK